jgi:hypothetical protein
VTALKEGAQSEADGRCYRLGWGSRVWTKDKAKEQEDKIKERRLRIPEIKAQEIELKRSRSESKS